MKNSETSLGLDDVDEFEKKSWQTHLREVERSVREAREERERLKIELNRGILRKRAPHLMEHQREFLILLLGERVSQLFPEGGRGRKGQPDARKTPFLQNGRTTPQHNVRPLPLQQHSTPFVLFLDEVNAFHA